MTWQHSWRIHCRWKKQVFAHWWALATWHPWITAYWSACWGSGQLWMASVWCCQFAASCRLHWAWLAVDACQARSPRTWLRWASGSVSCSSFVCSWYSCLLCCLNVLHTRRFTQLRVICKAVEHDSMSFSDHLQFPRIGNVNERPQGGTLR